MYFIIHLMKSDLKGVKKHEKGGREPGKESRRKRWRKEERGWQAECMWIWGTGREGQGCNRGRLQGPGCMECRIPALPPTPTSGCWAISTQPEPSGAGDLMLWGGPWVWCGSPNCSSAMCVRSQAAGNLHHKRRHCSRAGPSVPWTSISRHKKGPPVFPASHIWLSRGFHRPSLILAGSRPVA